MESNHVPIGYQPIARPESLTRMELRRGLEPRSLRYESSMSPSTPAKHGAFYRIRTDVCRLAACCPGHWTKNAKLTNTICQRT